jgi:dihydroflavonol-4-reductase
LAQANLWRAARPLLGVKAPSKRLPTGDLILVTGATGFVGSAVLRALAERGETVRVLARPSSPRRNLDGVACAVVEGDMTDAMSMRTAMTGVRQLYHVAADYRLWARDPGELRRANLSGAKAVMEAALAAGVERIVYTSSVATLRAADAATIVDETAPLPEAEAIGAYKQSKVAAERLVEQMVAERGLPAVIVSPSTPIGPRDIKPTPTGRMVLEAAQGKIPAFVDTGLNLVHVDDVAAGHLLAMAKGRIGERYILGGQDLSLRQMLTEIAALVGRKAPTLALPRGPLYPLAYLAEAWAQVTGKEPMLTRDALKMASHHMFFSSAKAERELGYTARPHGEALEGALAWFRDAGYLA